jgi:hypothetical protein
MFHKYFQSLTNVGFNFEYVGIISQSFFSCAPHAASKLADLSVVTILRFVGLKQFQI